METKLEKLFKEAEEEGSKQKVPMELQKLTTAAKPSPPQPSTHPAVSAPTAALQYTEYVKQSIQCYDCGALFDYMNQLKVHVKEHRSSNTWWRDVGSGAVYDMCGVLQEEGSSRRHLMHKYLCGFCSFRASQK